MSNIRSPWILALLFAAVSSTASAQDSDGPIARLVSRFREPAHTHQHVHTAPAAPAYDYTYSQAQPAATEAVEQELPAEAAPAVAAEPEAAPVYDAYAMGSDPYGFTPILNQIRASVGLHPLVYDPNLSSWAQQNNAEQCRRGLGHHVNPAGIQNCAYNYGDANSAAQGWMNSPGHRQNMLSPSATHFGIAFGPGPYWTLNAR
ncbi:CAP domain-containing protein [Paludisphaera rhizosphaerae]|uniref:CAP domain-containing protein n=1 Tax=Paludisphaera rhizosphaerae TaxID=2711216 RepID=UPI0013ECC176|nr:CAP domain-containing protein [Paludisphaera rhizosphaerae]